LDRTWARSCAQVAASSSRNSPASKLRSISTSMSLVSRAAGGGRSRSPQTAVGDEDRAGHGAGAGLGRGHRLHDGVAGRAQRDFHLAQPGPVVRRVWGLGRHAPVEGEGAVAAEPHARGVFGWATGPASASNNGWKGAVPRRWRRSRSAFVRRARQLQPALGGDQLVLRLPVALPGTGPGQDEAHPGPQGQGPAAVAGQSWSLPAPRRPARRARAGQLPHPAGANTPAAALTVLTTVWKARPGAVSAPPTAVGVTAGRAGVAESGAAAARQTSILAVLLLSEAASVS
jgi:hypothetical protein